MRPDDELTMYAHGLLDPGEEGELRAHLEGCPACAERVERLREERRLLERAARREPVPPAALQAAFEDAVPRSRPARRRSLVPFALAAALLLGLAGVLLYRPAPGDAPADAKRNVSEDPIDRLIGELKSPNPLRREVAALALTAYGQAAAPNVQKANVDAAHFPGIRWTVQDPKVLEILRTTKLDLSFENERADVLVQAIGEKLRLTIVVDAKGDPRWDPAKSVTFKTKDLSAYHCLKLFGSQFGLEVFAEDGQVILSTGRPPGQARAPIRIGNRSETARELVRALEGPSEDERSRAERELARLNFAAEKELWPGLDSPFARARETCARLLRRLYDRGQARPLPASSPAVKAALREKRVTLEMDDAPLTAFVDYLRQISLLNIHLVGIDNPDQRRITLKGADLALFQALTLALEPQGLGTAVRGDVVQIVRAAGAPTPGLGGPLWTSPDEAARVDALLEALGSRDPSARRGAEQAFLDLGEWALAPLEEAARLLDLPLSAQARSLRSRIFEEHRLWLLDEGSGADLQELTAEQERTLGVDISFSLESVPAAEALAAWAKTAGARLDLRTSPPGDVSLSLRDVPLRSLLKAVTRPRGCDFYLEGDRIVVDAAAKVRAAVEK